MIHEKCKKRCCVCADNTSFHLKFVAQTSRVRFYEKISEPHHKKKKKKHTPKLEMWGQPLNMHYALLTKYLGVTYT